MWDLCEWSDKPEQAGKTRSDSTTEIRIAGFQVIRWDREIAVVRSASNALRTSRRVWIKNPLEGQGLTMFQPAREREARPHEV